MNYHPIVEKGPVYSALTNQYMIIFLAFLMMFISVSAGIATIALEELILFGIKDLEI